jgi:hypothetical protein
MPLFSLALRITKQNLVIGAHGVDHFGLIVMALRDFGTLMTKHGHGQSHMGPVMHRGAGYETRTEQMRIDPLAEGGARPSADEAVEPVLAKRPTALA